MDTRKSHWNQDSNFNPVSSIFCLLVRLKTREIKTRNKKYLKRRMRERERVERGEKILNEIFRSQLFGVPMRFQARTGVRARPLCFSGCKGRKNKTVN